MSKTAVYERFTVKISDMREQVSIMFGSSQLGIQKVLSILLLQPGTNPKFLISLITSSTLEPVASKKISVWSAKRLNNILILFILIPLILELCYNLKVKHLTINV